MAATAERRGSLNSVRRASQAYWSSEPRSGSWSNIRRASAGFAPPNAAGGGDPNGPRRSLAGSSGRREKEDSEKEGVDEEYAGGDIREGEEKYHRLGWKKLTVCLIVEAIALGSLSIPGAFAVLGMVPGVILCVGLGFVAIYTSYVVGQVRMRHPHVAHYADAVQLIWGKFGYELAGAMFAIFLILITGSHVLTGTIAWIRIVDDTAICALVWGVISAIILFIVALPPTFAEFAILGYIDFVSIILAILITIIATGVKAGQAPGGLSAVDWSVWPPPSTTFYQAFLSTTNIIFAYSFAVCQYSFMAEMHTPKDYVKSIWALGLIEMLIYTLTGALVYAFVGSSVQSPALLSAGPLVSRVAFGIALPVIFISGSINSTVVGRYILNRALPRSEIRLIHTKAGWLTWLALIATITLVAWVIAEAIPFFSALLGIISSLFISGFTFYFPALFWF
ncbi:N amino acid transport system protein, partial [Friedmanniomyces simplex]